TLPSPFKSPRATAKEYLPVAYETGAAKLPSPFPTRTVRSFESEFAVTRSDLPSPFRSADATEKGPCPVAAFVGVPKTKAAPAEAPEATTAIEAMTALTTMTRSYIGTRPSNTTVPHAGARARSVLRSCISSTHASHAG